MPRSPITAVAAAPVAWRRLVARRPWVHWVLVATLASATATEFAGRLGEVAEARDAWGTTRPVLVAAVAAAPGEQLVVDVADVPAAVVPPGAIPAERASGLIARQYVGPGEMITEADVAGSGELALVPPGWLAVPVAESPPSGAAPGERVQLVSDGMVIAPDAVVAGRHDDITLIAVPGDVAPVVPAAAQAGSLVVLRAP